MKNIEWDAQHIEKLLNCVNEDGRLDPVLLSKEFPGVSHETLTRRYRLIKNQGVRPPDTVLPDTPEVESAKDRKIVRLEDEVRHLRRLYKSQSKQSAGMDALVEAIYQVAPTIPAVAVPEPVILREDIEEESLVLCLGDVHYGQIVDPEENGGISSYNTQICRERFEFTIDTTIRIAKEKLQNYHFRKLHIFALGDFVSGIIHDELKVNNEVNIVEQVLEVSNMLAEGLLKLCREFPEVHFSGVVGNHGRTEQAKYFDQKAANNYDYMVYKFLEKYLANQPNLTFDCPKSWWVIVDVEGTKFCVMHGDNVKGWGGIPFYGLSRTYNKMRILQEDFGAVFHHMIVGHIHNSNMFSVGRHKLIINGALVGGDSFSIGAVNAACDPTQFLFGVHPRKGMTSIWELNSGHIK